MGDAVGMIFSQEGGVCMHTTSKHGIMLASARKMPLVRGPPLKPRKAHPALFIKTKEENQSMLKRQIKVTFRLTPAEYESLVAKAAAAGLSREAFLRTLLEGCQIRPRPPDSYKDLARDLASIGNNINQIAHTANSSGTISYAQAQQAAALMRQVWRLVEERV